MKKTTILASFVFGMVLGNGIFILPAKAEGDCVYFSDQYGATTRFVVIALPINVPEDHLFLIVLDLRQV